MGQRIGRLKKGINPPKTLILLGPTAVGKTDLLVDLLEGKGEVVSADSMQVYRELEVGVAKPSERVRRSVPHHLIDILSYREHFSVGEFVRRADVTLRDIAARDKWPVIVGGTAFYIKNFLYGIPSLPPTSPSSATRQVLWERWKQEGGASLHRELHRIDPLSGERIAPRDGVRLVRALEVYQKTGRPLSSFPLSETMREGGPFLIVGLTREKAELHERIAARVERMFEEGLEDEFDQLIAGGAQEDHPGMRAIGYREFFLARAERAKEMIQCHTRQYAKKQITFFNSFPDVRWFSYGEKEAMRHLIGTFFEDDSVPIYKEIHLPS